ncbi:hypothetical protein NBRC116494_10640 [Aurantivibrio plasticivorans]
MAYVVTQACIGNKHTSCVDVCPVEAFREDEEMLFIDPTVCIDCNACISECPEQAIYPQSAVPQEHIRFIELNATESQVHPVIRESFERQASRQSLQQVGGNFAIVGSGPSGFYTAEAILKERPTAKIDIFERLPTPFGLVRYGVAPDHPRIKSVTASFERIAQSPQVRFFGNVRVGSDITREQLLDHYHSVVYATGGSSSRPLNIPGARHKNIFGSSEFVGWYNGHPDQQQLPVDLSGDSAAVIGIGNVALDIARMLILPAEELAKTDTADIALDAFKNSNVDEVFLLARRGPAQASFTPKELEQLMAIPNLDLVVDKKDLELDQETQAKLEQPEFSEVKQNITLLKQIAEREKRYGKRIRFMFYSSPTRIELDRNRTKSLTVARNDMQQDENGRWVAVATDQLMGLQTGLIVHAIGYQGEAIADIPFDDYRGVISNDQGIVLAEDGNKQEYAAGWIKRGASGVIGSNKQCANQTVRALLANVGESLDDKNDIQPLLLSRNVPFISYADWQLLDKYEQETGRSEGRPRKKVTDVNSMLYVIAQQKTERKRQEAEQQSQPITTHFRSCVLCEAMCGIKIDVQGDQIINIAGDENDPHSEGHICPKGYALQDLHNDPDRIKTPLEKVDGEWLPISWEDAYKKVAQQIYDIQQKHGDDAISGYWGNPGSHNFGLMMGSASLKRLIGSRNMHSAASLDQMPHQLVSYLMFGHSNLFTIPDVDRTDYMIMLGANPAASNGSLMTGGDILKRLESIQKRGGKTVLIDPRRNETARYVSEHHFIRPASDPFFLVGMIQHIVNNKLYNVGRLEEYIDDLDKVLNVFSEFSRELSLNKISDICGIPATTITELAEEFAKAERAVFYGRMGMSAQRYGALNHWLIVLLNMLTGNLDRAGGTMFTTPAFNKALQRPMGSFNTYQSRVRGLPECDRQLPAAVMAEEMLQPGEGQVKGFICAAGNPVLSVPNGTKLDQALEGLDFMVSIDFYINETSRHADIILPPTGPFEHEQYDIVFNLLAVRNLAKFSEPLFEAAPGTQSDWDIVNGINKELLALKNPEKTAQMAGKSITPHEILDGALRTGPYGKGFSEYNRKNNDEVVATFDEPLSLEVLKRYPSGLDLGPMQSNFPQYLFTEDKKIKASPKPLVTELKYLQEDYLELTKDNALMLIGRRDLRTNNSWMHNSQRLVKGKNRCALFIHPHDAAALSLTDSSRARVQSRVGALDVDVKITDDIMPGVVSLPHGWGHNREGVKLRVAATNPGISMNDLTDDQVVDGFSGNAVLNGIPVSVVSLEPSANHKKAHGGLKQAEA